MTAITLDLHDFTNEALREIAYAIAKAGPEMLTLQKKQVAFQQLCAVIMELESHANRTDTSELREMAAYWATKGNLFPKNPAAQGAAAAMHK